MTEEEFLEMEAASDQKHEFVGGRVRLYNAPYGEEYMAGASLGRNKLAEILKFLSRRTC